MSEKETSKIKQEVEPIREFGRDININVFVGRHGEKSSEGELSALGFEKAKEKGQEKEIPKDGIKFYVSPFRRTVNTAEAMIKGIEEQNKQQKVFKTRVRLELAPPDWEHEEVIFKKAKEIIGQEGEDSLTRYILSEPLAQKDLEKWSSGLAYLLDKYIRMGEKLYSHSDIELEHISHDWLVSDFLRKVAILKDEEGNRIDLENLDAIGGPIKFLEGFNFKTYIDENGAKHLKIIFREREFEINEEKFKDLVQKFKEEPYKGRDDKQDWREHTR